MNPKTVLCALALALACVPFAAASALAGGADWQPIDSTQLSAMTPVVEKDADAEAIFWDVRVEDQESDTEVRTVLTHYLRIKIYTEHGKETESQVDIPYHGATKITDIAGRTIKPDGTIVLLKPDAVFDRTIVKVSGVKIKAKSFAMPAVEPGCIIEYRWKETRNDEIADHIRLQFQRDISVQRVTYHIKPLNSPYFPYGMRTRTFHLQNTPFAKEDGGFYATSVTNVPAFHEEPHMPAEDMVRPWMLVYYTEETKEDPQKYWQERGKKIYEAVKGTIKVNDDIKKAEAEIVGDASTPDAKLARIYDYCRTQIKDLSSDASGLTADQRNNLKDNKNPWDTLKAKQGTDSDIDLLFASLATAAGFDVRIALTASHDDMGFDPSLSDTYFLRMICIAVKVGDGWRFCDPSETYRPYGMLDWRAEGQQALITDPKSPVFVETPVSDPDKSVETRTAKLTLTDDGTLDGDVHIEYTGHLGAERKKYNDDDSPQQREQTLRDAIKSQWSTAEVTNITIDNVTDPIKPFVYSYHIHIPGYAQRTGKRLFLQPAFFETNKPALFTAADRRYLVAFRYAWSEKDDITINLPKGFALDNADAPQPMTAGKVGAYEAKILAAADSSLLELKRSFFFGGGGALYFQPANYSAVKQVFDIVHDSDGHTITLKQTGSN
jgi:hypothetical protein